MSNYEYAQATDADLIEWTLAAWEDQQWEAEQQQTRWAEAGGYASGLTRPA